MPKYIDSTAIHWGTVRVTTSLGNINVYMRPFANAQNLQNGLFRISKPIKEFQLDMEVKKGTKGVVL